MCLLGSIHALQTESSGTCHWFCTENFLQGLNLQSLTSKYLLLSRGFLSPLLCKRTIWHVVGCLRSSPWLSNWGEPHPADSEAQNALHQLRGTWMQSHERYWEGGTRSAVCKILTYRNWECKCCYYVSCYVSSSYLCNKRLLIQCLSIFEYYFLKMY
jgi:hypothetical protein